MNQLEARLLAAVFGLALIVVGLALTANFRGVTQWHVRKSFASMAWLERIPPWSWLPRKPLEKRVAVQVMVERGIGATFTCAGILMLIVSAFGHFTGTS
jgi:hypothetical protein